MLTDEELRVRLNLAIFDAIASGDIGMGVEDITAAVLEALTAANRLIPEEARVREERCFDPYKNAFLWRTVIETPWGKREVQGDE